MNILLLTTHFNVGGISKYLVNLSRGLIQKGHNVVIASSPGDFISTLDKRVSFFPLNIKTKSELSPKIFLAFPELIKLVRQRKIEIIHAQTRVSQVLAFYLSKVSGIPYLSTSHGFFKPRLGRRLFPCWGERVIAISQPVKEHLIRDFKTEPFKIVLIPNGVRIKDDLSLPDFRVGRRKYGLKEEVDVIGFMGRLSPVKGIKYLIMAMSHVLKTKPNAQLIIVGEGKIKQELKNLTKELGIVNSVFFLGTIANTDEVFSLIDIFALPSLQEGLGLSLLEAMAMAKPVIGSEVGGILDVIQKEENGLLVSPGDARELSKAIIELLDNKEKAREMGKKARETVREKFSLERMVEDTEKVYEGIRLFHAHVTLDKKVEKYNYGN